MSLLEPVHLWQIGDVEFRARPYKGGWLFYGTIGCMEVFEEEWSEHPIERIIDSSQYRVLEWLQQQHTLAVNFNPSDVL